MTGATDVLPIGPFLMVEAVRAGAITLAVMGRVQQPGIVPLAHLAGKLTGNHPARVVDQVIGQHGGGRQCRT